MKDPIRASTLPVSSRALDEIDKDVRRAKSRPLPWMLLIMLLEAPGLARDIALSLNIGSEIIEHELSALEGQRLVMAVREPEHHWYRLTDRRVADCISAHHTHAHAMVTN